jgi:hypothetical protein
MRSRIAAAVFALVATISLAQQPVDDDYPEVSRLGKNILYLTEVSTPGFSTPKVLYGKTKNATEEPKYKDYMTPLGQRQ